MNGMMAIALEMSISTVHGFMLRVIGLAASTRDLIIHEELESGEVLTDLVLDDFINEKCCILELKKTRVLINVMLPHKRPQHR